MGQYRLQLMPKLRMHLGLDDTDSARNGCTTYIVALLVEKLEKLKVKFLDYPNLVRLNPNVPWKTRGNGALCLRFEYDEEIEGEALGYNTCRGIIGALAAIGENLEGDHTYELIAYRTPENRGAKRKVDVASIFEMDKLTQPYTFNNVDLEKRRVIITPRGPDPILLGIRGEKPEIVRKAFAIVKPLAS